MGFPKVVSRFRRPRESQLTQSLSSSTLFLSVVGSFLLLIYAYLVMPGDTEFSIPSDFSSEPVTYFAVSSLFMLFRSNSSPLKTLALSSLTAARATWLSERRTPRFQLSTLLAPQMSESWRTPSRWNGKTLEIPHKSTSREPEAYWSEPREIQEFCWLMMSLSKSM